MRAPIAAFRKAFPLTSERDIQAALLDHAQDLRSTYAALEAQETAELTIDEIMDEILQHSLDPGVELDDSPALPSPKRPLIQEVEDLSGPPSTKRKIEEITEKDDTSSSESSGSGSDQPKLPRPTRKIVEEVTSESDAESDSGSSDNSSFQNRNAMVSHSSGSSSNSSDDEDSSGSGSSDSDSDSDSSGDEAEEDGGAHGLSHPAHQQAAQSSDSSSDDSSDSDTSDDSDDSDDSSSGSSSGSSSDSDSESDSEPEEATAKAPVGNTKTRSTQLMVNLKPANAPKTTTPTASVQTGPDSQVGRGQGMTKTQKRNQRRREAKQNMRAMNQQSGSASAQATADKDADLVARKKALLAAVAANDDDAATVPQESSIPPSQREQQPQQSSDTANNHDKQTEEDKTASPQDDTPRRRMRMDMGAGRRMLFGALGLKNPKTKADEEKLKKDLMKDVRPLKNHRQEEVEAAKVPEEEVSGLGVDNDKDEAEDDWRGKITYRAVECCHDGIVLSEPPFPFIQRWDPQQQYSSMRKRKRSSQNLHQDHYEDDSALYGECQDPFDSGRHQKKNKTNKKKKKKGGKGHEGSIGDVELNYDDPPASKQGVDSQMTDLDDLPSLPTDVSALPLLEATMVKPGMVITWKQLLLSKATNWQPELLTVTGLVVSLDSDKVLHLILAKRDREEQKTYDEETGQRIYDRFEVPSDSENEDDGEDDGHREIPWSDLIEPRIVQVEPTASTFNTPRKAVSLTKDGAEDGNGSGDKRQSQPASAEDTSHTMDVDADGDHQSGDSASIPSGQNGQVLDFSAQSIDAPTTSGESGHNISQTQSVPLASSQASSQVNVFPPSSSLLEEPDENSRQEQITGLNGTGKSPESGSVSSYQDAEPSLETDEGDGQHTPTASHGHVQMTEPSSANNERSGRQMDTENGAVRSPDDEEEVIPDTNESAHETTPKPSAPPSAAESSRGSSPFFPSIEEIWHTAATSRQTKSPFKSSQISVLRRGKGKNDEEYQAAMQRLDEGDESDSMPDLKNKSIRNLFPNATQPSLVANEPDVKKEGRQPSSSFHVPDGSQVIMLDSSSPMAEDYADEDVGEMYAERHEDSSSLPHGSGWVTKSKASRNTRSGSSSSRAASKESLQVSTSKDKASKSVAPLLSANAVFGKRKSSGRKF
jgi:hypothetical protein